MKKTALTKSESEVMYLLWHTDRALSAAEMVALSPQKTWKDSYIHLMVNSLLKKGMIAPAGFVKTFRNYARTFAPCITEEEYAQLQMRDKTIQDPALVAPFLSAMIDTADDPASMIDELCCKRNATNWLRKSKHNGHNKRQSTPSLCLLFFNDTASFTCIAQRAISPATGEYHL